MTRARGVKRDAPMAGGSALKQAVHIARARAGITSDVQLALQAGIHYDTLMNWFAGRTVPRPAEIKKVADVLGTSYADLIAAFEGRDPEPPAIQDAIAELVSSIGDLVREIRLSRAEQAGVLEGIERAMTVVAMIREAEAREQSSERPPRDEPETPQGIQSR